jgi:hypothetical protein
MANPYGSGFDKRDIRHLPGCAFFVDQSGTIHHLGYTEEGATLNITANNQEVLADETGAMPLDYKFGGEVVVLALIMLQTTKGRLAEIVPALNNVSGNLRTGNVPGQTITKQGKVVHRPFAYPAGEEDIFVTNAVFTSDSALNHQHNEPMSLDCEFTATVDEDQPDGRVLDSGVGQ